MGTRGERKALFAKLFLSQVYFFVPEAEAGIFVFTVDGMMDCWHLTLKELIDALYVCGECLKLGGEKCVDFIYSVLTHSNKGDSPMKQCA